MQSNGGVAGAAHHPPRAGAHRAVGAGRRRGRSPRRRRGLRHQRHHHGRYRRNQRRHRAHQGRRDQPHAARPCRRMAAAAAHGRHGDDRRGRRLDRPGGEGDAHRRPAQRRRAAGPRLLRPRRRRGHGHRRPCACSANCRKAFSPGAWRSTARSPRRRSARASPNRSASPIDAAARGMLAIIDSNMVGAIRVVSVERGHDPRDFTLVAFGGAGPLHGCSLAELLGIENVLIPPAPGVLCAEGLLAADLKAEFSRTLREIGQDRCQGRGAAIYAELEAQASSWFEEEAVAPRRPPRASRRLAALPWPGRRARRAAGQAMRPRPRPPSARLIATLYGFTLDAPIELVTLRIEASGRMPAPVRGKLGPGEGPSRRSRGVRFASRMGRAKFASSIGNNSERATASKGQRSSPSSTRRRSFRPAGTQRCIPRVRCCLRRG